MLTRKLFLHRTIISPEIYIKSTDRQNVETLLSMQVRSIGMGWKLVRPRLVQIPGLWEVISINSQVNWQARDRLSQVMPGLSVTLVRA